MPSFIVFFNDTATTEIYTLSLHDALPICPPTSSGVDHRGVIFGHPAQRPGRPNVRDCGTLVMHAGLPVGRLPGTSVPRSEEHTSELQSRQYLVCRLLLEKKNKRLPLNEPI